MTKLEKLYTSIKNLEELGLEQAVGCVVGKTEEEQDKEPALFVSQEEYY